ncbi:MAG TPA: hypothetical protein VGP80_03930 [Gemmatimonadales bacterium]|jgi:hypothetical protein|nr:hypothetical protein [Gemmatimonadales bacterium]
MVRMFRPGMWVGLLLGIAFPAMAQESTAPRIELRENTPNPFFPSTTITFEIHREVCNRGHQPVVTLRVYNVLVQVVAAPTLKDSTGQRLENVRLRCGSYLAYWDGKARDGHEVPDGVYYYQLVVDGERVSTRKMIVRRGGEH